MALSKPERISKLEWNKNIPLQYSTQRIMEVCCVLHDKAVSVEIIQHLLGGDNMDYNSIMEVEDSIYCFNYCKGHLLAHVKDSKQEIMQFKEHHDPTSTVLIVVLKQEKTNSRHENIILHACIRMSIMVTPKVAFARYLTATGKNIIFKLSLIYEMAN